MFVFFFQVISNRMQKSVLVAIDRLVRQKKYDRILRRTTKLMVSPNFHHRRHKVPDPFSPFLLYFQHFINSFYLFSGARRER